MTPAQLDALSQSHLARTNPEAHKRHCQPKRHATNADISRFMSYERG